jgi:hypothetical protein
VIKDLNYRTGNGGGCPRGGRRSRPRARGASTSHPEERIVRMGAAGTTKGAHPVHASNLGWCLIAALAEVRGQRVEHLPVPCLATNVDGGIRASTLTSRGADRAAQRGHAIRSGRAGAIECRWVEPEARCPSFVVIRASVIFRPRGPRTGAGHRRGTVERGAPIGGPVDDWRCTLATCPSVGRRVSDASGEVAMALAPHGDDPCDGEGEGWPTQGREEQFKPCAFLSGLGPLPAQP